MTTQDSPGFVPVRDPAFMDEAGKVAPNTTTTKSINRKETQ
ncbi:hypothetical protein M2152_002097 [Microbacteriaceae bacterium SG_E_30_P1]|uniref:Uncharacterized protein n=1 Tax=Antiquaquibacter oligotrophicus TaxID=2880260 RepID=A0ABT6KQ51_9MICO|nr:hypothetical protein [Antiquaquibacter oligotrophicus]